MYRVALMGMLATLLVTFVSSSADAYHSRQTTHHYQYGPSYQYLSYRGSDSLCRHEEGSAHLQCE